MIKDMANEVLSTNIKNIFEKNIGPQGITQDEWAGIQSRLTEVQSEYAAQIDQLGYTRLPEEFSTLNEHISSFSDTLARVKDLEELIILGIGGPDLGGRAIKSALVDLNPAYEAKKPLKVTFSGDTTDPAMLKVTFSKINYEKTLVLVISKSGNTLEQASNFVYLFKRFEENITDFRPENHFAFITDAESGSLRKFAQDFTSNSEESSQISTFPVPTDVGGRFSVLSVIGMLPASAMGLNVQQFLAGANSIKDRITTSNQEGKIDFVLEYAAAQYLLANKHKNINVLFPYNYQLKIFGNWFRQLWAESLGKKGNGTTPVVALGPVDQHSQLQLYNDGPDDKVFNFLYAKNESFEDISIPKIDDDERFKNYHYFSEEKFSKLLEYELRTTRYALTRNGKPNSIITLQKVDEYNLGALFYFMEVVVSYMGLLLDINAYDQPGVELSKNAMYSVLAKPGYESELDSESLNLIEESF